MEPATRLAIEAAARDSRAQLLAYLAACAGGDVTGAEDALSEAFLAALRQWPTEGVPQKPEAWLLTTARRRLTDMQRRGDTRYQATEALSHAIVTAQTIADAGHDFPDERLKLLFVCAHPAIDPAARTPLMMQMVLGIEVERIASAFLTAQVAMSQRLVRAKMRIRAAGIPFIIPAREEWSERLGFVLDAVYAAYTASWDALGNEPSDLASEAIWLARVLVRLLPDEPEALGLLSLLLHCEARRLARYHDGRYVPLPEQDTQLWNAALIAEAESTLHKAAAHQMIGRFQIEAAIQSIHAERARTGCIYWQVIVSMYALLLQHTDALGARLGHAIAVAKAGGAAAGLALLDALPQQRLTSHQPWWAARAALLAELGRHSEAHSAYQRAIGLCVDTAAREFLIREASASAALTKIAVDLTSSSE